MEFSNTFHGVLFTEIPLEDETINICVEKIFDKKKKVK